jgi:hypothetical protein
LGRLRRPDAARRTVFEELALTDGFRFFFYPPNRIW